MKYRFLFGLVLAGLFVTTPAMGATIITFTFDENGNGTVSNGVSSFPLQTVPGQGTLAYNLTTLVGANYTPGDVLVREPGETGQVASDLLRFTNTTTGLGLLLVYSDFETGAPKDLADVGVPGPPYSTNAVLKDEVGAENGRNGVFGYTPGPNDPGGLAGTTAGQIVYNFISDTPEPASITLAGIGAVGLIGYRLRRRHAQRPKERA
jgi:hypothetical protein